MKDATESGEIFQSPKVLETFCLGARECNSAGNEPPTLIETDCRGCINPEDWETLV